MTESNQSFWYVASVVGSSILLRYYRYLRSHWRNLLFWVIPLLSYEVLLTYSYVWISSWTTDTTIYCLSNLDAQSSTLACLPTQHKPDLNKHDEIKNRQLYYLRIYIFFAFAAIACLIWHQVAFVLANVNLSSVLHETMLGILLFI